MGKTLARQKRKAAVAALEPAVQKPEPDSGQDNAAKLSALVSTALEAKQWNDALKWLATLTKKKKRPRLGSVQRWVRFADLAGDPALTARLLDAVLRASGATPCSSPCDPAIVISDPSSPIIRHAPWEPLPHDKGNGPSTSHGDYHDGVSNHVHETTTPATNHVHETTTVANNGNQHDVAAVACTTAPTPTPGHFSQHIHVVAHQAAHERSPPSMYDLNIWATQPGAIRLQSQETSVSRLDVPFVPGAFVMTNVLSRSECNQMVAAAEAMGFQPDVDYTFSPGVSGLESAARNSAGGERANGVVWLADDTLQGPIYERCRPHLPQQLSGGALAGLNCRWRLYRYGTGAVYRPHVDGAWPGSGLKDGGYEFDAFGDRWSRLTFLIYLNSDFEGGSTTFYGPGQRPGTLEAHSVQPQVGNVLCFPHGDTAGSLIHEGANVQKGIKYVVRTDVLYTQPQKAQGR